MRSVTRQYFSVAVEASVARPIMIGSKPDIPLRVALFVIPPDSVHAAARSGLVEPH